MDQPQNFGTDSDKLFVGEVAEADFPEVGLVPGFERTLVGPLADGRAQASDFRTSGRLPRQKVRKVEKIGGLRPKVWQLVFYPKKFRSLHLKGDFSTDIFEN